MLKHTNNKGVTYIELILVITVMTLMVAFATISMGTVSRNNIYRAKDEVISSINNARSSALTNGSDKGWSNFTVKNGNLYHNAGSKITIVDFNTQNWEKVCSKNVQLKYGTATLTENQILNLNFKQSTGEYLGYHVSTMDDVNDMVSGPVILSTTNKSKTTSFKINEFGKIE